VKDAAAIRSVPTRIAAFTPAARQASADLKQFMLRFVFSNEQLVAERRHSRSRMAELFQFFLDHPQCLPESHAARATGSKAPRVICDYIAGMTDGFFHRTYQQTVGAR